jgi:hypothetical protein
MDRMNDESTRRGFLERMAVGAAAIAGWSALRPGTELALAAQPVPQGKGFDLTWADRIKGTYKAVFDATEIESGAGLFRAALWKQQYAEFVGAKPEELSAVLVIRHSAIPLAMSQEYWDKYAIGKKKKVTHPFTDRPTDRNPATLSAERNELPAQFATLNLAGFQQGGGIVLACNLALMDCVRTIAKADKVDEAEARTRAVALMVPGVVLQPSGVFGTLRAQDAGCHYIKAS